MKPVILGTLVPFPVIWVLGGLKLALFSVLGAMALLGIISLGVEKGWLK